MLTEFEGARLDRAFVDPMWSDAYFTGQAATYSTSSLSEREQAL